jgi:putative NADH-flavin reductase
MNLTVLGATGGVGRHVVRHALVDGHKVTAVVRDPAQLGIEHESLSVVRTNPLDATSLTEVIEGADAVLSGIGQAGRTDPLRPASTSARAAVEAMVATGVRRIVVMSSGTLNRTGVGQPWFSHRVLTPALWAVLRDAYIDLERMERILRESGLDWTAVRPPRLTNAKAKDSYRDAIEAGPTGTMITRADVARAMLDYIAVPGTIQHAVGVSN